MHPAFREVVDTLHPSFERLISMQFVNSSCLPKAVPKQGVYLFSENGRALYVGRTNDIRKRLRSHCQPSAGPEKAAFAFKLAREATGMTKASYLPNEESREGLMGNPSFAAAFISAKERVSKMDIRFVEEADQRRQALLEIYCAVSLDTPYNDFGTY